MSLYDDASLIMYPSGYKEDKLYSLKPTNGDGDFTFTRASSATRVNAEGLIEEVSVLGSELITNGDFATDSDWSKETGWTISGGNLVGTSVTTGLAYQNSIVEAGKQYKATFDVVVTSGVIGLYFDGGTGYQGLTTTTQTVTVFFTAVTASPLYFRSSTSNFTGSIDNVSVKEVITNNVPRLDYSGGASCASLLLEPQRSNLVTYSESFDNAAWSNNGTIVPNASISPDGTQNADLFYASTSTGRRVFQNKTIVSGSSYTVSVYAKANNKNFLYFTDIDNQTNVVWFDLLNGTYSTPSEGTANIESIGNDWYRCSLTTTSSTTTGWAYFGISDTSGSVSFTANGTDGVYLWGAQVEQGSYPTSYIISNSGSTTTRTADACNGAGTSATFNDSEGVLMAEIAALADGGTSRRISISDDSGSDFYHIVSIELDEAANTLKTFISDGSVISSYTYSNFNQSQNNKVALKYNSTSADLYINGFNIASISSPSLPTGLVALDFDSGRSDAIHPFYGKTKQLQYFPSALTDSELEELTSWTSFSEMANAQNYTII